MAITEQIKQLETKLNVVVEYIQRLTDENAKLREENSFLKGTVDSYRRQVATFEEEQNRIHTLIAGTVEQLNRFESITHTGNFSSSSGS
ncbi:MAG: cell division protein ZapB [Treponema sp.]|jgi:predicted nuclease with TOPRIM domain|nr:cell division protein ZapB [Treponema sp.]